MKKHIFNNKKELCLSFEELTLRPVSAVAAAAYHPIWQLIGSGRGSAKKEAKDRKGWPELS